MNTCVVTSAECNLHFPGFSHSEHPSRLNTLLDLFNQTAVKEKIAFAEPRRATRNDVLRVHSDAHISYCEQKVASGSSVLDQGDTYICSTSLEAAYTAAGSVLTAADLLMQKKYEAIFCAVRPPGHHAEKNTPMGFCIFNNIAVGAAYMLETYGIERVAIIDWDVHHGNGTQDIFYTDKRVFFISLHQSPLYPGTGSIYEQGEGEGKGYTLNFPVKAHSTGAEYMRIFENEIIPALSSYEPQALLISAGFDAHTDDPLASVDLQTDDYAALTRITAQFALNRKIPYLSVLEGGYNLRALSASVAAHLNTLTEL